MTLNVVLFIMIYAIIGFVTVIMQMRLYKNRANKLYENYGISAKWDYENSGLICISDMVWITYIVAGIFILLYPITFAFAEIRQIRAYRKVKKIYEDKKQYEESLQEMLERWARK